MTAYQHAVPGCLALQHQQSLLLLEEIQSHLDVYKKATMKEESVRTVELLKHHCGEMDHKALSLFAMRVVFVTKRQDGDQLLLVLAQTFRVANLVLLLLSRGGSTSWEKS